VSLFEARVALPFSAAEKVSDLLAEAENDAWGVFEDVAAGRAWLVGIFPSELEASKRGQELANILRDFDAGAIAVRELGEAEWRDSYKAHFHAWQFGRLHWVPVWERGNFVLPPGDAVLWLDPGLAFGTGNHETTRLCVERLVAFAEKKGVAGKVVDVGCGSGILALSAAKLGFRNVVGFDNDPEAVRVSEENAASNGLTGAVRFLTAELPNGLAGIQADVVLANILADVLMRFSHELTSAVAPGGGLVLSGILATECAMVLESFARVVPTWTHESRTMGQWSDLVFTKPSA